MHLIKKFESKKIKINQAITLIELLVVIGIIGLLATIMTVSINNSRIKTRDAKRKSKVAAPCTPSYGMDYAICH